jgi:hypothetical protein
VVVVRCPTGCGPTRRPYARRTEAVRCGNCTAWFAAAPAVEDGTLVDGVLLARPGEPLPGPAPAGHARALMLALIALAAAAALVQLLSR